MLIKTIDKQKKTCIIIHTYTPPKLHDTALLCGRSQRKGPVMNTKKLDNSIGKAQPKAEIEERKFDNEVEEAQNVVEDLVVEEWKFIPALLQDC